MSLISADTASGDWENNENAQEEVGTWEAERAKMKPRRPAAEAVSLPPRNRSTKSALGRREQRLSLPNQAHARTAAPDFVKASSP